MSTNTANENGPGLAVPSGSDDLPTQVVDAPAAATPASSSPSSTSMTRSFRGAPVVAFPLVMLWNVFWLAIQLSLAFLPPRLTQPVREFMAEDHKRQKVLSNVAEENYEMQQTLVQAEVDQDDMRDDLDDLRRRIRKIEERRERWANEAARIRQEKAQAEAAAETDKTK